MCDEVNNLLLLIIECRQFNVPLPQHVRCSENSVDKFDLLSYPVRGNKVEIVNRSTNALWAVHGALSASSANCKTHHENAGKLKTPQH